MRATRLERHPSLSRVMMMMTMAASPFVWCLLLRARSSLAAACVRLSHTAFTRPSPPPQWGFVIATLLNIANTTDQVAYDSRQALEELNRFMHKK